MEKLKPYYRLTMDEINVLMVCMSYYVLRHPWKTTINGIDIDIPGDLFNKLEKQREMLEENI